MLIAQIIVSYAFVHSVANSSMFVHVRKKYELCIGFEATLARILTLYNKSITE